MSAAALKDDGGRVESSIHLVRRAAISSSWRSLRKLSLPDGWRRIDRARMDSH